MAINLGGTSVIDDSRQLLNITGIDDTTKNAIPGFKLYSEVSNSSAVSLVTVYLNPNADVHYIVAELSEETASNNQMRMNLRNSSNTIQNVKFRTMANSTTSTWLSTNSSYTSLNYWNMGSNNSTTFGGDRLTSSFYVHSKQQATSAPFDTPIAYGTTVWEDDSGNPCVATFASQVLGTGGDINRVTFFPITGNIDFYRIKVYSAGA